MSVALTRRQLFGIGCLMAADVRSAFAGGRLEIAMRGSADGSRVWFEPVGVHIASGTTVRWTNRDPGNSHTTSAYSPLNDGHPLRIPADAKPWNSDYLLPGEHFEVRLIAEGVYDYFCRPHEMAGMAGRIVVGTPPSSGFWDVPAADVPQPVLASLPSVATIMSLGRIEQPQHS